MRVEAGALIVIEYTHHDYNGGPTREMAEMAEMAGIPNATLDTNTYA